MQNTDLCIQLHFGGSKVVISMVWIFVPDARYTLYNVGSLFQMQNIQHWIGAPDERYTTWQSIVDIKDGPLA